MNDTREKWDRVFRMPELGVARTEFQGYHLAQPRLSAVHLMGESS